MARQWNQKHRLINRRFIPLYVYSFLTGFIFWYAIEKLFMVGIGFDPQTIGYAVAIGTLATLVSETPFGVLADRWSRKGVLILMPISLALASLICGLSESIPIYIVGLIFFGVAMALESGNTEAIIYDSLLEETGDRTDYEAYYGRIHISQGTGLVVGSLLGGLIATAWGLQATYLLTIPGCILAIFLALSVHEPSIHKAEENPRLLRHFKEIFQILQASGRIRWIIVANVSLLVIPYFLMEVDQLWTLALALPLVLWGPFNALLLSAFGAAGTLGTLLKKRRPQIAALLIGFCAICLLSVKSMPVVALGLVVGVAVFCALEIVASGLINDEIPSRMRAGVLSALSTASTIFYIPLVAVFGYIADRFSIFQASYMLIPIAAFGLYAMFRAAKN